MEKKFTSDEVPLKQLLGQAKSGQLQLPDFQRGWVWDDEHIASLLASISLSYPIGAVMTLQTGNPDVKFRPRWLEGVVLDKPVDPEFLLLDGQQRLTSLFLALLSGEAVSTQNAKGARLQRRYYVDIRRCIDPEADREEAIHSIPADRVVRTFRGEPTLDLSTREREIAEEMFPLEVVLDSTQTMSWQMAYLQHGPGDQTERFATWSKFNAAVVEPFNHYQVPTIQLARPTPKEAVCQVFEKVNTGGVSLTVFELLTATYAADDFNLRDDWEARQRRLAEHSVLNRLDATSFLQVVTLLATRDGGFISCKRRDVLNLSLADYERLAEPATRALERVVPFLHTERVFRADDVPYATQLVPLAAILAVLGKERESLTAHALLARWYWSGVFGEMYGGSTETRFALDLADVVPWVRAQGSGDEPRTVREAQFQADRLLTLRTRGSAAYKGLYALQMQRGARDFRTGRTIDVHSYFADAIDIHHIFPRAWCAKNGVPDGVANSIVNKTAIDALTNRRMGGRAPSSYLATIEDREGIASATLDELLRSHDIDPLALRRDDFAQFFDRRFERLLKQIESVMGKPVNRRPDRDESPFADPAAAEERLRQRVRRLLEAGESKISEFKSTGRKNLHTGDKDAKVEWAVIKSIAGFMNASGGTLVVGVADDGALVGLDEDFPFLKKPDRDGWALWLGEAVGSALGKAAAAELEIQFCRLDGKDIAVVDVGPAAVPVFARDGKGQDRDLFVVRAGNSTHELAGQDALTYQKQRWG